MKLAVIGASGKAGSKILTEAKERGLDVTAIVRNKSKLEATDVAVIEKDLFELTYDDLKDFDVIIDALGAFTPEVLHRHVDSMKYLGDLLENKPNRLLIIAGAGSLYVNKEHTVRLIDTPDFPNEYKPVSGAQANALDYMRLRPNVKWTFLSPASVFIPDAPRTGSYILGGEDFIVDSKGNSQISYSDYAIAMVDEAVNAKHINERICAISES